ncbi:pseudouridylate synthase 7 homolog [Ischnura elegans]|uniref:pseudouridylate synthase 7 homolog n=1 Tax=Ischnura elegans TaxID=197161 RepID=UPI001ED89D4F|nr:pseudouridylate synthase 7 homolog [Ischnura elegans]XP_046392655.1 pseudouridylate synthase 7 homolog [Ischnura elegans]
MNYPRGNYNPYYRGNYNSFPRGNYSNFPRENYGSYPRENFSNYSRGGFNSFPRGNSHKRPPYRGNQRGRIYKRRGRPGQKNFPPRKTTSPRRTDSVTKEVRCSEEDVGIKHYVGQHQGFSAVIKQRYSDFHVSEIDLKGDIVQLTTLETTIGDSASDGVKRTCLKDYDEILSKEVQAKLMLLHGADFPEVEIEVTDVSKEERKKIHEAVKNCFGSKLVSNTVDRGDKKFMVIGKPTGKQRTEGWPQGLGKFVHFVLYKENLDTMEAANLISQKLRIPIGKFTYAGTKDRRAKTTQLVCVPRVHPKKIAELNGAMKGVAVGNFECLNEPLRLGDLKGNRFQIVLRNVTVPDSTVEEAATSLKEKGFVNYYGLQRFGSTSIPTHHIGKALLLGKWKDAVDLILKPRKNDGLHLRRGKSASTYEGALGAARKIWWDTQNANAALKALDRRPRGVEGHLLYGLKINGPNDLVNALERVPLNLRLMYLHSYQSYIWNHVASKRIQEFGLKPIEGDLVFIDGESERPSENIEDVITECEQLPAELPVEQTEPEEEESVEDDGNADANAAQKNTKGQMPKVRALTEKDLETAKIEDVVLPLPGYDITYPNNVVAKWYEELLAVDGLSSETMKQNVRKYSLRGTYRKLVEVPKQFSWRSVNYNDVTVELVQSDLQKVNGEDIPAPLEEGKYKGVIVDLCLPSSSYATMALRELLKSDSSLQHQMLLNSYYSTNSEEKGEKRKRSEEGGDERADAKVSKVEETEKDDDKNVADVKTEDSAEEKNGETMTKTADEQETSDVVSQAEQSEQNNGSSVEASVDEPAST